MRAATVHVVGVLALPFLLRRGKAWVFDDGKKRKQALLLDLGLWRSLLAFSAGSHPDLDQPAAQLLAQVRPRSLVAGKEAHVCSGPDPAAQLAAAMSKPERASHSLKTTVRAVLAAQRFAESGGHGVMGGAGGGGGLGPSWVGTSNYHRDEVSEVPFAALIHFMTFSTEPELSKPWQMKKPSVSTGTGFYIGDKKILTNSHVIRHSTSLRVERHGQPGNFPARVLCEGVMCDLAIVTVDHDDFFVGLPAVKFQPEVPELDDTVICLGYPLGATSITVTRGVVSNVHMKDLSLRGWNDENLLLAVQIGARARSTRASRPAPSGHRRRHRRRCGGGARTGGLRSVPGAVACRPSARRPSPPPAPGPPPPRAQTRPSTRATRAGLSSRIRRTRSWALPLRGARTRPAWASLSPCR